MSTQDQRISFLIARDGRESAKAWALDAARGYRKVLLKRQTHLMYRTPMIRAYLELKRFALESR